MYSIVVKMHGYNYGSFANIIIVQTGQIVIDYIFLRRKVSNVIICQLYSHVLSYVYQQYAYRTIRYRNHSLQ